jgi:predicted transcriptional regulator
MIDNQLIEKVKQYRYLGEMFNASGSFSDAKEELYKRGLKALFKMYKCFEGQKPKIKTLLHIFDHTVKPILTYGSENIEIIISINKGYLPSSPITARLELLFPTPSENLQNFIS